jgi:hypothetical protein
MDVTYNDLIDELNELRNSDKVILSVLSTIRSEQITRIFDDGLDANDKPIGVYSTKPIYIAKKNQARNTRSSYFEGGYKEYKQAIGFDGNKVNLVNTGQMRDDYSIITIDQNTYGLGFNNDFNSDKADWNETHFKKDIFAQSPNEDIIMDKAFDYELNRIFGE